MERTVHSGGITLTYTLMRTGRKDILLRALPGGVTRVYAPSYAHLKDIDAVVREHAQAIREAQAELDAAAASQAMRDGDSITLYGQKLTLRLIRSDKTYDAVEDGEYRLYLKDPSDPLILHDALAACLSRRALPVFRARLTHYAQLLGVTFGRCTIREQKTRWGSCSSKGNLNFNWKLILAPPEALDYVVIHELCHLKIFNHSARFWALVGGIMPEYAHWKQWLADHGKSLAARKE